MGDMLISKDKLSSPCSSSVILCQVMAPAENLFLLLSLCGWCLSVTRTRRDKIVNNVKVTGSCVLIFNFSYFPTLHAIIAEEM